MLQFGVLTANSHYIPIGVCLTNREDTQTFEILFNWIKESTTNIPYALMSDGDKACRRAALTVFGEIVLLMCYYHQKKSVKRKLAFVKEKDDQLFYNILTDLHQIHLFTLDEESFNVIFALFTRKYSEEVNYYNDYLKIDVRTRVLPYLLNYWASDKMMNLWYQGSNPQVIIFDFMISFTQLLRM